MPSVARLARWIALATTAVALLSAASARAEWLPNGNPAGAASFWQADPSVAPDQAGGAFVAWGQGICAGIQRFESTGALSPGWPSAGFPTRLCDQSPIGDRHTRVVPDGDGGVYVASSMWPACVSCQADPMFIGVQRLGGNGVVAAGWPAVGVSAVSLDPWPWQSMLIPIEIPRVAANGSDGVLLAWQAQPPARPPDGATRTGPIYAQSIGPDGTRRWGEQGLLVCAAGDYLSSPEIVPDGHGGAFVFWCGQRTTESQGRVFAQHVDASGSVSWAAGGIPVSEPYRLRYVEKPLRVQVVAPPFAVADGARGAIVSWAGRRGADLDVFAARVTRGGGRPWKDDAPVCVAPGDQFDMRLVPLPGGGAIVGWLDVRASGTRVASQRLTPAGRAAWGPDGIAVGDAEVVAPYWSARAVLAMSGDESGGAFFAWPDTRPEGDLFALRLAGDGTPEVGWPAGGAVVSRGSGGPASADMVSVGNGNVVIAWQAPGGGSWATLLTAHGPAGAHGGAGSIAARRSLAEPVRSESGATSSAGVRLDPGGAGGRLVLWLADASPASLEVFDPAGRKLISREFSRAGEHEVRLVDEAALPAGLYLARLTQGAHRANARVVILR